MSKWSKIYLNQSREYQSLPIFIKKKIDYKLPLIKTIKKYIKPGDSVLEAGCGIGLITIHLNSLGYKAYGIDKDKNMISIARSFCNSTKNKSIFKTGNIKRLTSQKKKYDLIFSNGVMEHFSDAEIIKILNQELATAKIVVFSVPSDYFTKKQKIFGDERFLNKKRWHSLINRTKGHCIENFGFNFTKSQKSNKNQFLGFALKKGIIVSFDGNVYTGKTALIKKLNERFKYNFINEYSFYRKTAKKASNDSYLDKQLSYLCIDKIRKRLLEGSEVNLLDRSFVSLSAHVWAIYKISGINIIRDYLKALSSKLKTGEIIVPDSFVWLSCDYKTALRRLIKNEKTNPKGTKRYLINPNYFKYINEFNSYWLKETNGLKINSNSDINENIKRVNSFIKKNKGIKISSLSLIPKLSSIFKKLIAKDTRTS